MAAQQEVIVIVKAKDEASKAFSKIAGNLGKINGVKLDGVVAGILKIGKVAAAVAGGALIGLTAGVVALGKSSIETAADFQQAMANAAAIMGEPLSAMRELEEQAKRWAIDPRFRVTAIEAANAIEMLARNGVQANDILGGMLEGTILLANSVGTDLSNAADIATDAMNIFGLEANEMLHAVDQMTGVVNNSKFTIDDYFLALGRAGASFAPAGGSFEDFNAALALIAPYFNSGQRAGTSFANFVNRLIPTTDKAKNKMIQLGLASVDAETGIFSNHFINQDPDKGPVGQLKAMADVIDLLQDKLGGLTAEDKLEAIITIFGRDAQGAVAALLQFGDGFEDMVTALENTDAVESAATRMGTLAGAIDVLKGFFELLRIELATFFLPVLSSLAVGLQTLVGNVIDKITPKLSGLREQFELFFQNGFDITSFQDWADGIWRMAEASGNFTDNELFEMRNKLLSFVEDLNHNPRPFGVIKDALVEFGSPKVVNAVRTVNVFRTRMKELIDKFKEWSESEEGQKVIRFIEIIALKLAIFAGLSAAVAIITAIGSAFAAMATPIGLIAGLTSTLIILFRDDWNGIRTETWPKIKLYFDNIYKTLSGRMPSIIFFFESFKEKATAAFELKIQPGFMDILEGISAFFQGDTITALTKFKDGFGQIADGMDDIGKSGGNAGTNIFTVLFGTTPQAMVDKAFGQLWPPIKQWFQENFTLEKFGALMANLSALNLLGDLIEVIFDSGGFDENTGADMLRGLGNLIVDAVKLAFGLAWEIGFPPIWIAENLIAPILTGFTNEWGNSIAEWDWLTMIIPIIANMALAWYEAITPDYFQEAVDKVFTTIKDLFNGDTTMYQAGIDILSAVLDGIVGFVLNTPEKIGEALINVVTAITEWLTNPERDWKQIGYDVTMGILEFFADIGRLKTEIDTAFNNLQTEITNWFNGVDWETIGKILINALVNTWAAWFSDEPIDGEAETISTLWDKLWESINNWFNSPERKWHEFGENVIQGFIDGVNNMWDAAVDVIKRLGAGIKEAWDTATGSHSPSREFAKRGKWVVDGLTKGINDNLEQITVGANVMANTAMNPMANRASVSANTLVGSAMGPGMMGPSRGYESRRETLEHVISWDEGSAQVTRTIEKIARKVMQEEFVENGRKMTARRRGGV